MNNEEIQNVETPEVVDFCINTWGFSEDGLIPDYALSQAEEFLLNKKNKVRIGKSLVKSGVLSEREIEEHLKIKGDGYKLGEFIGSNMLNMNQHDQYEKLQKSICLTKDVGLLFVEKFPDTSLELHPLLKDENKGKALITECESLNAVPILIGGNTPAIMFQNADKAIEFRDSYPRQKQFDSTIFKEFKNFKVVVTKRAFINQNLSNTSSYSANSEGKSKFLTETSLKGDRAHEKLAKALNFAAEVGTDIHFEPSVDENESFVKVRIRRFSFLLDYTSEYEIDYTDYQKIVSKILIETGATQTGGTNLIKPSDPSNIVYINSSNNKKTEFRVSIIPKGHGEQGTGREQKSLVFRVFNDGQVSADIEKMNFSGNVLGWLKKIAVTKRKMTLLSGTTGSGKSSTIAALVKLYIEHHNFQKKVITVEDPVERMIKHVLQIQISEQARKEYEREGKNVWVEMLRAIMRHDPDGILVGEVRDAITALMASQFAATGHEVWSTIHATTFRVAITRILDLFDKKSERSTFIQSLGSIVTQRLVPIACSCSVKRCLTKEEIEQIKYNIDVESDLSYKELGLDEKAEYAFINKEGCEKCSSTGIIDQKPVNGILVINKQRRQLLLSDDNTVFESAFKEPEAVLEKELMALIVKQEVPPTIL